MINNTSGSSFIKHVPANEENEVNKTNKANKANAQKGATINDLPNPVLQMILSRTDFKDIKSTTLVNKKFNIASKKAVVAQQINLVKNYINLLKTIFIKEDGRNSSENLQLLNEAEAEIEGLRFKAFTELKPTLLTCMEKIADALKIPDRKMCEENRLGRYSDYREFFIRTMGEQNNPQYFNRILDIANQFRKFDVEYGWMELGIEYTGHARTRGKEEHSDGKIYTPVAAKLVRHGMVDRAIKAVDAMTLPKFKHPALLDICNQLVDEKAIVIDKDRAIELFNTLPAEFVESNQQAQEFKNKFVDNR